MKNIQIVLFAAFFALIPHLNAYADIGTVKWFNATKGFGFIEPEDASKDVFVYITAVERAGLGTLYGGQKLSYTVEVGINGKWSAKNLKLIDY